MYSVGERLREARLSRGLTQEQLARGLATKGFISQVERNRTTPSLAKLRLMADRLGLPLGHFTGDSARMELSYLRKSAELAVKAREADRAMALVEEGLRYPTTANERADLLRIKGTALEEQGRLSEAMTAHQLAVAMAPADDPDLNAAISAEIGYLQMQREQFNAATEANLRALSWLDRSRHADPALRARVLNNLGRCSYALGELAAADGYLQRALDAALDAESLYRIANAHMALGISARAIGELDRALEHCSRALELHSRIGQHRAANMVLNNLGDVHYAAGRKRQAAELQHRCLARAREMHDDFEVGVAAGELARYALEEGRAREATALARESQEAAARSGDHLHHALSAAFEATAAEQLGHPMIANRKFRASLQLLAERQAGEKLAEVGTMFAEVLHRRGDHDRAFAVLRIAAERDFSKLALLLKSGK